jgi:hypothetical protein
MSLLPTWEKLQPLRPFYVRLLDPDGGTYDVWQNHLEAELEGLNEHHKVFRSNSEWQEFLSTQRKIATDWELRHTVTDFDRHLLATLKILWEPLSMRGRRYRVPAGHALVRASDGGLWYVPAGNIEKARAIDPKLQVLHVDYWRN